MSTQDEKSRRRRPMPEFPIRLVSAMKRSELADAEISRLTGIARNVLSGYKKGATFPGVAELSALCEVLQVSANQLIHGTEQPFKTDPLRDQLGIPEKNSAVAAVSLFFTMLQPREQDAVLMIVHSILEARHGKGELDKAKEAIALASQEIGNAIPDVIKAVNQIFTPVRIAGMEKKLLQRFPDENKPKSSRQKRRR